MGEGMNDKMGKVTTFLPSSVSIFALLFLLALPCRAQHQPTAHPDVFSAPPDSLADDRFQVYDGESGEAAQLGHIVDAMKAAEVVFIGEKHDDAVAHALQYMLFRRAYRQYGDTRTVALSMEMFARDVQSVLDEYLAGLITERHFLAASRPWSNYRRGYRPLLEYARRHDLPVIAANAPRRYVNLVARAGRSALQEVAPPARAWLPPLPYPGASPGYRARWKDRMQEAMRGQGVASEEAPQDSTTHQTGHGGHASGSLLDAQILWDATMAYSITELLMRRPEALVLHITGAFHMEQGQGTPEQLNVYRPGTRTLTVLIRPVKDVTAFEASLRGLADFVVLTEEKEGSAASSH